MAASIAPLIEPTIVASTVANLFTATVATRIGAFSLMNPSASTETVTVYWVPEGGSPATGNIVTKKTLIAGEIYPIYAMIGQTLAPGDMLQAFGATGGLVNIFASGTLNS